MTFRPEHRMRDSVTAGRCPLPSIPQPEAQTRRKRVGRSPEQVSRADHAVPIGTGVLDELNGIAGGDLILAERAQMTDPEIQASNERTESGAADAAGIEIVRI